MEEVLPGLVCGDDFAFGVDVVKNGRHVNINADYCIALGALGARGPGQRRTDICAHL